MKIQKLQKGRMYKDERGTLYKVTEDNNLFTFYELTESWRNAAEVYPFMYLVCQDFHECRSYTEDEKILAKQALDLGIKVIIKDKDGRVYCIVSEEIFKDDDGYWVTKPEATGARWIDANELPKLLKSSLAEKVTYDNPIYLKDVIE